MELFFLWFVFIVVIVQWQRKTRNELGEKKRSKWIGKWCWWSLHDFVTYLTIIMGRIWVKPVLKVYLNVFAHFPTNRISFFNPLVFFLFVFHLSFIFFSRLMVTGQGYWFVSTNVIDSMFIAITEMLKCLHNIDESISKSILKFFQFKLSQLLLSISTFFFRMMMRNIHCKQCTCL